jgi:hypothetical protein
MTPFPTLHLDHNNQALTKRFAYQSMKSDIWVLPRPKSQITLLKYANMVMTSRVGHHYQPTLWDALQTCACPPLQQQGAILRSTYHHKQQRKKFPKACLCEP